MLKVKETDIVKSIIQYLTLRKIVHAHVRNTGAIIKNPKTGKIFFANTNKQRGVADILGVFKGVPIAIEVKSEVGKLSPDQEVWLKSWADNGGAYCVARSVDHVEQFISSLGVN